MSQEMTATQEILNKTLDLIEKGANKIGSTASDLYPHIVKSFAAGEISLCIGTIIALILSGIVGFLLFKNISNSGPQVDKRGEITFMYFIKCVICTISMAATIVLVICLLSSAGPNALRTYYDPQGAFILNVLGR